MASSWSSNFDVASSLEVQVRKDKAERRTVLRHRYTRETRFENQRHSGSTQLLEDGVGENNNKAEICAKRSHRSGTPPYGTLLPSKTTLRSFNCPSDNSTPIHLVGPRFSMAIENRNTS